MPEKEPKYRNLIIECGLEQKAYSIIVARGITDERQVATILNSDPEAQAKLSDKKVLARDVTLYKRQLEKLSSKALSVMIRQDPSAGELVQLLHEKTANLVERAGEVDVLTTKLIEDINRMRDAAIEDPANNPYPTSQIDSLTKAMKIVLDVVKTIKHDGEIKQYLRAGSVQVNQGIDMDKMIELLVRTGRELGHTDSETMSAFARARMDPKGTIIDVEMAPESDLGPPA